MHFCVLPNTDLRRLIRKRCLQCVQTHAKAHKCCIGQGLGLDNYKGLASEKLQRVSVGEDGKGRAQKMLFGVRVREDINGLEMGVGVKRFHKGFEKLQMVRVSKVIKRLGPGEAIKC